MDNNIDKDMAVKFFPETIFYKKADHFKEFLNWCKIDRMVNDNSSSSNSMIFKKIKTIYNI